MFLPFLAPTHHLLFLLPAPVPLPLLAPVHLLLLLSAPVHLPLLAPVRLPLLPLFSPVHRIVDDKLVTLVAVHAELPSVHAHRVALRLNLVLQPVGRHIPAQSLSPSSSSGDDHDRDRPGSADDAPRVPAAVERAAGDTDPDGAGVAALSAPELGLYVREDGEARSRPATAHTVQVRALHSYGRSRTSLDSEKLSLL